MANFPFQVLLDMFTHRENLLKPLISPHTEYGLIISKTPAGDNAVTWFNHAAAPAAIHLIHFNDSWHSFVLRHFRPIDLIGDFIISGNTIRSIPPSQYWGSAYWANVTSWTPQNRIIPARPPAKQEPLYSSDEDAMPDEGDDSDDDSDHGWTSPNAVWSSYGDYRGFRKTDAQERVVNNLLQEMGKNVETRFWFDDGGKAHVEEFLHEMFSNPELMRLAVEKRLLSFRRVWTLMTDPYVSK